MKKEYTEKNNFLDPSPLRISLEIGWGILKGSPKVEFQKSGESQQEISGENVEKNKLDGY